MIALVSNQESDAHIIKRALVPLEVVHFDRVSAGIDFLEEVEAPTLLIVDLALGEEAEDLITLLVGNAFYAHIKVMVLCDTEEECESCLQRIVRPLSQRTVEPLMGIYREFQQCHPGGRTEQDDISYQALFTQVPLGIAVSKLIKRGNSQSHVIHQINPMFEKILGRTKQEIMHLGIGGYTNAQDWEREQLLLKRLENRTITHYSLDKRCLRGDGKEIWVQTLVFPLRFHKEDEFHYFGIIRDITEEKKLALKASEEVNQVLQEKLRGMGYRSHLDDELTVFYLTNGSYDLTGYTADELTAGQGFDYNKLLEPSSHRKVIDRLQEQIRIGKHARLEYEIITKSGEHKWVFELGRLTEDDPPILEGIILDFSHYKELEQSRIYENERIPLTGLLNRSALKRQMEEDKQNPEIQESALISINFTPLYESVSRLNHSYVEDLLVQIGSILAQFKSETAWVYGPIDYSFAIYLSSYPSRSGLEALGTQIIGLVGNLLSSEHVGWGVGIIEIDWSEEPEINELLHQVIQASDLASKTHSGRPAIRFYERVISELIHRESSILRELSSIVEAVDDDRLYLNYQPVVSVQTNEIVGFEALARLMSNELGLVGPSEFISIAEKYRLIIPLGYQILTKALRFQKRLEERGCADYWVSVNLSAFQLLEPGFANVVQSLMAEEGTNPEAIVFEHTESGAYSSLTAVNSVLKTLQGFGSRIALDDFGVGYSSLARESELNVDYVKIDKLFSDQIIKLGADRSVLGDVIKMIHKVDRITIVEGVEEERQLDYLKQNGCILYQGFLYSKPVAEEAALRLCT